jgi:hypothetical protein
MSESPLFFFPFAPDCLHLPDETNRLTRCKTRSLQGVNKVAKLFDEERPDDRWQSIKRNSLVATETICMRASSRDTQKQNKNKPVNLSYTAHRAKEVAPTDAFKKKAHSFTTLSNFFVWW